MSDQQRVAFVSGGAGGIGRATCKAFFDDGYRVALTDLDLEAATSAATEIDGSGTSVVGVACDVSSTESVNQAVSDVVRRLGRLDALVNVAGVVGPGPSEELSDESWDRLLSIHLGGTFRCSRAAFPALAATGSGSIVSISSIAATDGILDPGLVLCGEGGDRRVDPSAGGGVGQARRARERGRAWSRAYADARPFDRDRQRDAGDRGRSDTANPAWALRTTRGDRCGGAVSLVAGCELHHRARCSASMVRSRSTRTPRRQAAAAGPSCAALARSGELDDQAVGVIGRPDPAATTRCRAGQTRARAGRAPSARLNDRMAASANRRTGRPRCRARPTRSGRRSRAPRRPANGRARTCAGRTQRPACLARMDKRSRARQPAHAGEVDANHVDRIPQEQRLGVVAASLLVAHRDRCSADRACSRATISASPGGNTSSNQPRPRCGERRRGSRRRRRRSGRPTPRPSRATRRHRRPRAQLGAALVRTRVAARSGS